MKKIIISVVSIGLILIVGISALVLSLIPNGFNNTISMPDEIMIICSKTKDLSPTALTFRDRDEQDKDYVANIYSLFCHSFEQNALSAIFKGEFNKEVTPCYLDKGNKYISSNSNSENKITVCFKYNQSQEINDNNYNYLFFEITNDNERKDVELGAKSTFEISNENYYYNNYYTGKANFINLYNYVLNTINKVS